MKQSSAPAWLGWSLNIFSLNSGPQNLSCSSRDIHESLQTLVVIPFPMAFPSFSLRRFLPCKIPLHPCEQTLGRSTSRKFFLWQYLPIRILARKLSGTVIILHAILAKKA
ncbi:BnaA08g13580D [Brassica napus]|uniref:BnaA08g13580D protein n=1 Tax=Brassica napus TaxID=3708 RepID=A0A078FMT7_BRANA|nr:BnaA08g13580D [Brassica napus]